MLILRDLQLIILLLILLSFLFRFLSSRMRNRIVFILYTIFCIPLYLLSIVLFLWFWFGDGNINTIGVLIFGVIYAPITIMISKLMKYKLINSEKFKLHYFDKVIIIYMIIYINILLIYFSVNLVHTLVGSKMIIQ